MKRPLKFVLALLPFLLVSGAAQRSGERSAQRPTKRPTQGPGERRER